MTMVRIDKIRRDDSAQARFATSPDVVREYAETMEKFECLGTPIFPRIVLFFDGADHWLADGFHRVEAANKCGLEEIDADVRPGTQRDAVLFAAGANQDHGLQRNPLDKRTAVKVLLEDPEWSTWSDPVIAEHCGVSHSFVWGIRKDMNPTCFENKSDGVRKGKDGRTYNTENIGKTQRQRDLHSHFNPPVTEVEEAPREKPGRQTTIEEELRPTGDVPTTAPPVAQDESEADEETEMPRETPKTPEPVNGSPGMTDAALLAAQSRFVHHVKDMREKQREYKKKKMRELFPPMNAAEEVVDAELQVLMTQYAF